VLRNFARETIQNRPEANSFPDSRPTPELGRERFYLLDSAVTRASSKLERDNRSLETTDSVSIFFSSLKAGTMTQRPDLVKAIECPPSVIPQSLRRDQFMSAKLIPLKSAGMTKSTLSGPKAVFIS